MSADLHRLPFRQVDQTMRSFHRWDVWTKGHGFAGWRELEGVSPHFPAGSICPVPHLPGAEQVRISQNIVRRTSFSNEGPKGQYELVKHTFNTVLYHLVRGDEAWYTTEAYQQVPGIQAKSLSERLLHRVMQDKEMGVQRPFKDVVKEQLRELWGTMIQLYPNLEPVIRKAGRIAGIEGFGIAYEFSRRGTIPQTIQFYGLHDAGNVPLFVHPETTEEQVGENDCLGLRTGRAIVTQILEAVSCLPASEQDAYFNHRGDARLHIEAWQLRWRIGREARPLLRAARRTMAAN